MLYLRFAENHMSILEFINFMGIDIYVSLEGYGSHSLDFIKKTAPGRASTCITHKVEGYALLSNMPREQFRIELQSHLWVAIGYTLLVHQMPLLTSSSKH